MDEARLEELVLGYLNNALDETERAELNAMLLTHPNARRRLHEAANFDQLLAQISGRKLPAVPASPSSAPATRIWPFAIAAATLIGAFLVYRGLSSTGDLGSVNEMDTKPRASIVASEGSQFRRGEIIDERETIDFESGRLEIDIPDGAQRVRVRTQVGVLEDRGTRFSVEKQTENTEFRTQVNEGELAFLPHLGGEPLSIFNATGMLSLQEDGAIGVVLDREGLVQVRPKTSRRWTLARDQMRLFPGDWIRTGSRGAHAAVLRLENGTALTLGPDSLLEVESLTALRLGQGELELVPGKDVKTSVTGPGTTKIEVLDKQVVRSTAVSLMAMEEEPKWLLAYRADDVGRALGSLLANVDGREVALSMGFHKVNVDIRDQIARTVIEESFVNHTSTVLEGVFYFPLPADASISGFAMWVGNELIEGEIIEKERAREIYETLLREKQDPGLLEWSGGNLFKARVYPIHSEKRIRITYTQVLPREGSGYRYRYALVSDLTKLHPLREVDVKVTVASAMTLLGVTCPTHPCRIDTTEHAASIEFSAKDYVPTRDFEVVIGLKDADRGGVLALPHVRGDEGYFMVFLDAPKPNAVSPRDLLPEDRAVDVIVLADTSGSMSGANKKSLLSVTEALLSGLGENDRFLVGTVNGKVRWLTPDFQAARDEERKRALTQLAQRRSMGWSDLASAMEEAFARASAETIIVYIGDGVQTVGNRDAGALLERLQGAYRGRGRIHAVGVGSLYDQAVLDGLATLSGGSSRVVADVADAAPAAAALLRDALTPGLSNISVSFEGITVAAVHPEKLPNLRAGTQAVLFGRYDPRVGTKRGKVKVAATFAGAPVSYTTDLVLDAAEAGNSYIPRQWAKRRLDHLLLQGRSPEAKQRIIDLSETFQIITPYTSFLVLENEADRQRFQVQKRLKIRDGETFFEEGRDQANFDLIKKQMEAKKAWRRGLRSRVLKWLEGMGRADVVAMLNERPQVLGTVNALGFVGGLSPVGGEGAWDAGEMPLTRSLGVPRSASASARSPDRSRSDLSHFETKSEDSASEESEISETLDEETKDQFAGDDKDFDEDLELGREYEKQSQEDAGDFRGLVESELGYLGENRKSFGKLRSSRGRFWHPSAEVDLRSLFPQVSSPRGQHQESLWPKAILDVTTAADGGAALAALGKPFLLEFVTETEAGEVTSRWSLVVKASDWVRTQHYRPGDAIQTEYVRSGKRGVIAGTWNLGAERATIPGDSADWRNFLPEGFTDLARIHTSERATLVRDGDLVRVVVTKNDWRTEFTIDPTRKVLLRSERFDRGRSVGATVFADIVEFEGRFVAKSWVSTSSEGKVVSRGRLSLEALDDAGATRRQDVDLACVREAIVVEDKHRFLHETKQAHRDGRADISALWELFLHYAEDQDVARALPVYQAFAEAVKGRTGVPWLSMQVARARRGGDEVIRLGEALVESLRGPEREGDVSAGTALLDFAQGLGAVTQFRLVNLLKPVFERRGTERLFDWELRRVHVLFSLERTEEAFATLSDLRSRHPKKVDLLSLHARRLVENEEPEAALALLRAGRSGPEARTREEDAVLRLQEIDLLAAAREFVQIVAQAEAWRREAPTSMPESAYSSWLSALFVLGRDVEAEAMMREWLKTRPKKDAPDHEFYAQSAAFQRMIGQTNFGHTASMDRKWIDLVVAEALVFPEDLGWHSLLNKALGSWVFNQTAGRAKLVEGLMTRLDQALDNGPADLAAHWFVLVWNANHTPANRPKWRDELQSKLVRRAEADFLVDPTWRIFEAARTYATSEQHLALAEKALTLELPAWHKATLRAEILQTLRILPHTIERERRALELLPLLVSAPSSGPPVTDEDHQRAQISELIELVDWMVTGRVTTAVDHDPATNALTRRQLKDKKSVAETAARKEVLKVLLPLEAALNPPSLRPWIALERISLEAATSTPDAALVNRALDLLEATLANASTDALLRRNDPLRLLAHRTMAATVRLGAIVKDSPASLARLDEILNREAAKAEGLVDGKNWKYQFLLATDRAPLLIDALVAWFNDGKTFEGLRFGPALASLWTEVGELKKAAELLKLVAERDELEADEWRLLAELRHLLNDPAGVTAARVSGFAAQGAEELTQLLNREYNLRRSAPIPGDYSADVPLIIRTLLQKAFEAGNPLHLISAMYVESRDTRLLRGVAEAATGIDEARAHALAQQAAHLGGQVQEEATLDGFRAELDTLLKSAATDADRRALRLMELVIGWRAVDIASASEPHRARFLTALEAVTAGPITSERATALAPVLGAVGEIKHSETLRALLGKLSMLSGRVELGSEAHRNIAATHAQVLRTHARYDEAAQVLGAALEARRTGASQLLPFAELSNFGLVAGDLLNAQGYKAMEKLLRAEMARGYGPLAQRRLLEILADQWARAFESMSASRSGKESRELYDHAKTGLLAALEERSTERHAEKLFNALARILTAAHKSGVASDVVAEATAIGASLVPRILGAYQYRNAQAICGAIAAVLRQAEAPREALEFLVSRIENEPTWPFAENQDLWQHHGYLMSSLRLDAGTLPREFEQRLLNIVVREMKRSLGVNRWRQRALWADNNERIWRAKIPVFIATAKEVLAQYPEEEVLATSVANFAFHHWGDQNFAIDLLRAAHTRKILAKDGRSTLVHYLMQTGRHGDAVPYLQELIVDDPETMLHRSRLIVSLSKSGQRAAALEVLSSADKYATENKLWSIQLRGLLGRAAADADLREQAVVHLDAAIEMTTRGRSGVRTSNYDLSDLYQRLALVHAEDGRTEEAVNAAAGGIAVWPDQNSHRSNALETLRKVLLLKPEKLKGYLASVDAEAQRTRLENPILRASLGEVLFEKGDVAGAIVQYAKAVEAAPENTATRRALIAALDRQGEVAKATEHLLELADLAGRTEKTLWRELGERFARLEQPEASEHAYTNIVEILPEEAESHGLLGEIRMTTSRASDAAQLFAEAARLRPLEPTWLLREVAARLEARDSSGARTVLERLKSTTWPKHFGEALKAIPALEGRLR